MNKFKFFLPLAAVALLASCSNDNLGDPNPGQSNDQNKVLGDGAYLNINLAIPSTGTRGSADVYVDGDPQEYKVKNAHLYLFKNVESPDGNYPGACIADIPIDAYFGGQTDTSSEITIAKDIEGIDLSNYSLEKDDNGDFKDIWALVILNQGGSNDGLKGVIPSQNGTYNTYSLWANEAINYVVGDTPMMDGDCFTMTNALGWEKPTEVGATISGLPQICALVKNENIYYENSAASVDPNPVNIYVQRGLAKVSLTSDSPIYIGKWSEAISHSADENLSDEEKALKDYILLTGWSLDVTNQCSYPVQNLSGATNITWYSNAGRNIELNWGSLLAAGDFPEKRFAQLGATNPTYYYRLFWGVDPNYTQQATGGTNYTFNQITDDEENTDYSNDHLKPQYCLENTMAVDAMYQDKTTRVVFKGYYMPRVNAAPATTEKKGKDFISYNGKAVVPAAELGLKTSVFTADNNYSAKFNTIFTPYTFDSSKYDGYADKSETEKKQIQDADKKAYDDALDAVLRALNLSQASEAMISYHKDGIVYYSVLIRHFDDNELGLLNASNQPVSAAQTAVAPSTVSASGFQMVGTTYPTEADKYLVGRYGVVRNNWYELRLNSVKAVGTPYFPPRPGDKTDDEPATTLLDVVIKINAWAQRDQHSTLK